MLVHECEHGQVEDRCHVCLQDRCARLLEEVNRLEEELARMREGDWTEEEMQGMCHNLDTDDLCRFRQGCDEYQGRLFGVERVEWVKRKEREEQQDRERREQQILVKEWMDGMMM